MVVETRRSQLTIRVWPVWVPAESRANRMLRNDSWLRSYNDFAGRNGSGHCGAQPCREISRWAHGDHERGRNDSRGGGLSWTRSRYSQSLLLFLSLVARPTVMWGHEM